MNFSQQLVKLSLDRSVACTCDPVFHAYVGGPGGSKGEINACLRCGQVTPSELMWRHVHHDTYEPYDRRPMEVASEVLRWTSLWPRLPRTKSAEPIFFPADARFAKPAKLLAGFEEARATQLPLPIGRRLRQAGIPSEPPPALPESLEHFRALWIAANTKPEQDPADLLPLASEQNYHGRELVIDTLLRRADIGDVLRQALRNADHGTRSTVCAIVGQQPSLAPEVLPTLLEWLKSLPLTPAEYAPETIEGSWFIARTIEAIGSWKPALADVEASFLQAKARIGQHDWELTRKFDEVLRDLKGEPPAPISKIPWFLQE